MSETYQLVAYIENGARLAERAAIVAWLRAEANDLSGSTEYAEESTLRRYAARIESTHHLQSQKG